MTRPSPLRYFAALGLHAPYALIVLGAIEVTGMSGIVLDAKEVDSGFGMVLFAQLFLASTGFIPRARRGHFAPILVGGSNRTAALLAHWTMSVAPGVAGWIGLAIVAHALGSPLSLSALASRTAALFIVSAIAWAGGFALTRGAAGVMWMALLLALLLHRPDLLVPPGVPWSVFVVARNTAAVVCCPFLLIGDHPGVAEGTIGLAVLVAGVALIGTFRLARTLDVFLVERA